MIDEIRDEDLNDAGLVAAARRLGDQAAAQLDLDRTARGVVARWRHERASTRPFWSSPALLRMAAALILLVGGVLIWRNVYVPRAETVAVVPSDAGLEGLSPDQLQAILPSVDQAEDVQMTASDAGLEGLSVDELRSVLRQMGS